MKISVIIPVYKNVEMFEDNLRNNLHYISDYEVIIVNDDPSNSLQSLLNKYPYLKIIENDHNLGFAGAVNVGAKIASGELLMFLNSDVILTDKSFGKAIKVFDENPDLFAISFAQYDKNSAMGGKNIIYWSKGFFRHSKALDTNYGVQGWAEGGSMIARSSIFKKLSGFDNLYNPFYWEDIDLSYRAWKSGYEILFDPEVKVLHNHESTISKYFSKDQVKTIAYRNQFLFIWKNIRDIDLIISHLFQFILLTIISIIKLDKSYIVGLIKAIIKIPLIIKSRLITSYSISDHEILGKFKK